MGSAMALRLRIPSRRYPPAGLLPASPRTKGLGRPEPHSRLSDSHPAIGNRASQWNFSAGHQGIWRSRQPDPRRPHCGALSRAWRLRVCHGGSGFPEVLGSSSHQPLHVVKHREPLGKAGTLPGWRMWLPAAPVSPAPATRWVEPPDEPMLSGKRSRPFPESSAFLQVNLENEKRKGRRPSSRNGDAPASLPTGSGHCGLPRPRSRSHS